MDVNEIFRVSAKLIPKMSAFCLLVCSLFELFFVTLFPHRACPKVLSCSSRISLSVTSYCYDVRVSLEGGVK